MVLPAPTDVTPPAQPEPPAATRPAHVIAAPLAAAIVAATALSWDRPGIGWPLTATVVVAGAVTAARGRRGGATAGDTAPGRVTLRACWAVAAVMLLAVGAFRAAGWLFALCAVTAGFVGCVALAPRWPVGGVLLAPARVAATVPTALRQLLRSGLRPPHQNRETLIRTSVAVLIALALLAVFGTLLAGADAAFAEVLATALSALRGGAWAQWLGSAAVAAVVTAVVLHSLRTGHPEDERQSRLRLVRRVEWALPVGGLVALFAGFVSVQATVLFGGGEHVLTTAGLTYAQYARAGFWQLLAVTALTIVVVGAAAKVAPRTGLADRVLIRALLGSLSALTIVIVASAVSRMAAYEHAYGFTRLRLLVTAFELWLGVVFLLVLIAGIRLQGRWIPQAGLAAGVAALLGLAVLNPDAFIAERNIARSSAPEQVDTIYLQTLSADAVPALQALPEPYRSCALAAVKQQLAEDRTQTWLRWNLGRGRAKAHLRDHPTAWVHCPP